MKKITVFMSNREQFLGLCYLAFQNLILPDLLRAIMTIFGISQDDAVLNLLYFTVNFISSNHRRNHRKLLVIDNHIAYMGSANISAYSLVWRELNIRIQDESSSYGVQHLDPLTGGGEIIGESVHWLDLAC